MAVSVPSQRIAVVVLTATGLATARAIVAGLDGAECHGLRKRTVDPDVAFDHTVEHLQALFAQGRPIIAVCASGIVIRALAPVLGDKQSDPPVIAVAEDRSCVVPLLGGHHGANPLAQRVAGALQCQAAITTAGDLRLNVALDAPPDGYVLANPDACKSFTAALLDGEPVRIEGDAPWLARANLPVDAAAARTIRVTENSGQADARTLVYHPRTLALGVGCERGADSQEILGLVRQTLDAHQLSPASVAGVYSLDLKSNEMAIQSLARTLEVPARFFPADALEAEASRLKTPSDVVFAEVGCHGVAEGAALAAAGPAAELLVAKHKSARATCAIACAPSPFDGASTGLPQGTLRVVGVGPGEVIGRTGAAEAALRGADHWVGYSLYLALVRDLHEHQQLHEYPLGEEIDRVRAAIELAATGRQVALVCSGDPGIYAMASLVYETLASGDDSAWQRVDVSVVPGVSAFQVAAARAGAPIGHDFCAISLSDLLTPANVIAHRVEHAARGDFVVAFYNPVSRQRRIPFERAVATLREHRAPDTPVILGHSLGRPEERVEIIRLDELATERVNMLTVVLVGSTTTRTLGTGGEARVFTPRGYAAKEAFSTPTTTGTAT